MNTHERLLQIEEQWLLIQRYRRQERDQEEISRAEQRLSARIEAAIIHIECTEEERRVA